MGVTKDEDMEEIEISKTHMKDFRLTVYIYIYVDANKTRYVLTFYSVIIINPLVV